MPFVLVCRNVFGRRQSLGSRPLATGETKQIIFVLCIRHFKKGLYLLLLPV